VRNNIFQQNLAVASRICWELSIRKFISIFSGLTFHCTMSRGSVFYRTQVYLNLTRSS